MWIYWAALSISYIVTAFGQVVYKLFAHTKNRWHFLWAITFFIVAPFTSYIALKKIEVGMVFIGAAISQVLIMVMSHYVLKEKITKDHIISTVLILLGLFLYAIGR
jgi:drug/metabolite transporter (DMT)-like permease